jgi:hypothetical protein
MARRWDRGDDRQWRATRVWQRVRRRVEANRPPNVQASPRGYAGTYAADSFDLQGNVIPEAHAEGRLRGVRITVE